MKSILKSVVLALFFVFTINAFAEDLAAKEDITPPPPEGALKLDQIPPIESKTAPEVKPTLPPPPQT